MGNEEKSPAKVDLDYVLVNELGQLGWYQIRNILLVILPIMFGVVSGEYIFNLSQITTRCLIPQCDGDEPELTPSWMLNAIPGNSFSDFDNCNRYANITDANTTPGTCPASLFDQNQLVPCEQYVHERTNSAVYDFGLECDEWRRALAGTLGSIGSLLVLPLTGYISDRWGRRVALLVNAFNGAWTGILRAFAINYEMYAVLHLIGSALGGGVFSSCYILATELVGPKFRVVVGAMMSTIFALGNVALGLIAWAVPEWRTLILILYIPQVVIISYFWILAESVRWLLSKKKYDEAKKVLIKAAEVNKTNVSEKTIEALIVNSDAETDGKSEENEPWLVMKIIRSPIMFRRVCTTPIWWITTTFVYYGLNINSVSLAGNMYVNYILVAAIEIPGYWLAIGLLDRIGRKFTLCFGFMACSICCLTFALIPNNIPALSLALYLLGKLFISLVFTSIYIYTAELYPTRHRHSLLAFSSMIGRIGSITAPLTPALMVYWEGIPLIMFSSMAFISGLLVLTTPETLGASMPDTIQEAELIGRKKAVQF